MELLQYKEEVKRTLPHLGSFKGNEEILDSIHILLGMCSEMYELYQAIVNADKVNIGEELTDIAWYACNYVYIRGFNMEPMASAFSKDFQLTLPENARLARVESDFKQLGLFISELQDYDKKEFAYTRPESPLIRERREILIFNIFYRLSSLYSLYLLDFRQCFQNNIDKLRVRYPEKFSEELAIKRENLTEERKQLEK